MLTASASPVAGPGALATAETAPVDGAVAAAAGDPLDAAGHAHPDTEHRHPEVTEDATLRLEQVVDDALARHPAMLATTARRAEAAALQSRADAWIAGPPSASLRYQTDRLGGPEWLGDGRGLREVEPLLTLPLWRPGQREVAGRLGAAAGDASEASRAALALQIAGEVRGLLWDIHAIESELRIAERLVALRERHAADVERGITAGEFARPHRLAARERLLAARRDVVELQGMLVDARFRWIALTGLERRPPAREETTADPETFVPDGHPRLRLARAEYERSAAYARSVEQAARGQPSLTLGPRSERGLEGLDADDSFGIILSVPVGGRVHARAQAATAERQAAEAGAELGLAQRALAAELHEAEHELELVEVRLALARQAQADAAERAALAAAAFGRGELTLDERVETSATALQTRRELVRQESAHGLALARLNQAMGRLP